MAWGLLIVVWPLLQQLLAQVTMTTRETLCDPGYYLTELFQEGRSVRACRECESGTFRSHPSAETSCVHCALCRDDQEVVVECSPTSDRQCQCKEGRFYCDSGSCTESCFRCKRCEGSTVLHPCNATRDTVCATESNPKPGISSCWWALLVLLPIFAILSIPITLHNHSKNAEIMIQGAAPGSLPARLAPAPSQGRVAFHGPLSLYLSINQSVACAKCIRHSVTPRYLV
nr:tumor necrosis factor receptor superfamily member 26-like [Vicugna pacos]